MVPQFHPNLSKQYAGNLHTQRPQNHITCMSIVYNENCSKLVL